MKIGYRNLTSFSDFMSQFQMFAIQHPWMLAADVVTICVLAILVDVIL